MDLTDLQVSLGDIWSDEENLGGVRFLVQRIDWEKWDEIASYFGREFAEDLKEKVQSHGKKTS